MECLFTLDPVAFFAALTLDPTIPYDTNVLFDAVLVNNGNG